ncbi:MAG: T9SS type A sorting domain-containing protein, partial [candidate division WOR-3 bacterium]
SRYSGGRWNEPETITSDTDDMVVAACLDADQTPWAVWSLMRRLPDSAYSLWSRRQGDSWTHPRFVTTDTMVWGVNGDVAGDPNQGIWSVWTWVGEYANSYRSVFSSYCTGDTWTTPSLLDRCIWYMQPYSTLITFPPGGRPRAVWTGTSAGFGLYTAVWLGDSWSGSEPIPNSQMAWYPSVCSDSSGGCCVTWLDGWAHDSVYWAYHDGTGWTYGGKLGTGTVWGGSACCDELGRVWALWTYHREEEDSTDIWVRYFEADTWSDPILAISTAGLAFEARLVAAFGRLWAVWLRFPSWLLYYSHSQPVGISERRASVASGPVPEPTIVGDVLAWSATTPSLRNVGDIALHSRAMLLDATGRVVMDLQPGPNDIRHVAPGIYFLRPAESGGRSAVRKVVIQR